MLTRLHDWSTRLAVFFAQHAKTHFVWGTADCCLLPADAIKDITGGKIDIAAPFRGKYNTLDGAVAVLKDFAGGALPETMAKLARDLKLQEIDWRYARRGDLVLLPEPVQTEFRGGLAIAYGEIAVTMQETGLKSYRLRHAVKAWRI